ncbi:hypothetical protein J6590_016303 [Homalodisca vitripennis]|nr:hypothetical protein J6590_016303 [Homalodisca vitripennis]
MASGQPQFGSSSSTVSVTVPGRCCRDVAAGHPATSRHPSVQEKEEKARYRLGGVERRCLKEAPLLEHVPHLVTNFLYCLDTQLTVQRWGICTIRWGREEVPEGNTISGTCATSCNNPSVLARHTTHSSDVGNLYGKRGDIGVQEKKEKARDRLVGIEKRCLKETLLVGHVPHLVTTPLYCLDTQLTVQMWGICTEKKEKARYRLGGVERRCLKEAPLVKHESHLVTHFMYCLDTQLTEKEEKARYRLGGVERRCLKEAPLLEHVPHLVTNFLSEMGNLYGKGEDIGVHEKKEKACYRLGGVERRCLKEAPLVEHVPHLVTTPLCWLDTQQAFQNNQSNARHMQVPRLTRKPFICEKGTSDMKCTFEKHCGRCMGTSNVGEERNLGKILFKEVCAEAEAHVLCMVGVMLGGGVVRRVQIHYNLIVRTQSPWTRLYCKSVRQSAWAITKTFYFNSIIP